MSATEILLAVGIVQGVLFAAALWFQRRGPRIANRWLAILLVSIVVGMLGHWLHVTSAWVGWPRLFLATTTVAFLFGPLMWLYLLQLTRPKQPHWLRAAQSLHFLPWLLNLMLFVPLWGLPDEVLVVRLQVGAGVVEADGLLLLPALKWISLMSYTVAGLLRIRRWRVAVEQQLANTDAVNLRWLLLILLLFLAGAVVVALYLLLDVAAPVHADTLLSIAMVALVLAVGVAALRQPTIFSGALLSEDAAPAGAARSAPRSLTPERSAELRSRLARVMDEDRIYRDRDISLAGLASAIGVTPHQLSELLNAELGCSFYDYVNERRVRAVQQALEAGDRPVLDLALEAGFNNKSTFNKAFRKVTGTTPSAWRRGACPHRG